MSRANTSIIVLKFGGSVLASDADLCKAVHECYRWVRAGWRVVAVVSALSGTTDALLERVAAFGPRTTPLAAALLVSTGELSCAASLGLALSRAGVASAVLTPHAIGLRAQGSAFDASACGVDADAITRAFAGADVLVVPGFIGVDNNGHTVLLGRGGSDLTALFVAQRLGARCRLIKDVAGLFDRDPARPGPPPRRFREVSWDRAIALGGGVVQEKSLRFAREHRLPFEVAALAREEATLVGPGPDRLAPAALVEEKPLKVALLGAGVVGLGVYQHLRAHPARFEVSAVAVRDVARAAQRGVEPGLLTNRAREACRGADVVVELVGGVDPAVGLIAESLRTGRHVVTANKAALAAAGGSLRPRRGARLLHSGAAGGAAPVLEAIARARADGPIRRIEGVLNGTTNYILEEVRSGRSFDHALRAAQEAGLAEADPSRDVSGRDAADKLALLADAAFDVRLDATTVARQPISPEAIQQALRRAGAGARLRHVAWVERRAGRVYAGVELRAVDDGGAFFDVPAEENLVLVLCDSGVRRVRGKGAGRWPTAEAVFADLLDLSRLACAGAINRRVPGPPWQRRRRALAGDAAGAHP